MFYVHENVKDVHSPGFCPHFPLSITPPSDISSEQLVHCSNIFIVIPIITTNTTSTTSKTSPLNHILVHTFLSVRRCL